MDTNLIEGLSNLQLTYLDADQVFSGKVVLANSAGYLTGELIHHYHSRNRMGKWHSLCISAWYSILR